MRGKNGQHLPGGQTGRSRLMQDAPHDNPNTGPEDCPHEEGGGDMVSGHVVRRLGDGNFVLLSSPVLLPCAPAAPQTWTGSSRVEMS